MQGVGKEGGALEGQFKVLLHNWRKATNRTGQFKLPEFFYVVSVAQGADADVLLCTEFGACTHTSTPELEDFHIDWAQ